MRPRAPRSRENHSLHLPKNTAYPFFLGAGFFVFGFGLVFSWWVVAALGFVGIAAALVHAWFDYDEHKHVHADVIRGHEAALGRLPA